MGARISSLFAAAVLLAAAGAGQEGGIEVFAGETLYESGFRVSFTQLYKPRRDLYRGSSRVADPLGRSFVEHRSILGIDYGLERRATLTLLVPFVYREQRSYASRERAGGLGDITALGKYNAVREDWRGGAFNASLIGGLELPTGATDATENGQRLPPGVQVGSGAWNPFAAVSATLDVERSRFDATLFYKLNTEGAQRFEAGDFLSLDVSASYRFLMTKYPGPTAALRLGLQWRHEERAELGGASVANSGVDELLLKPVLATHPIPSMDLSLSARIPVWRDVNGEQLGRDVEVGLAVGFRF